jgi:transcriptional antiterminator NusG
MEDGKHWYVIHTYSGYEQRVKRNLEHRIKTMGASDTIFQVVIPTEEEIEIKEGKRRTVARKIFPGYILVEMALTDESWNVVRNTPGVTGFVGAGTKPVPLNEDEVSSILNRMKAAAPVLKVGFRKGESARIIDGPFVDFIGTVDEIYGDKGKVRVMVSFFGRDTPVELDFLQVEKF